MEKRGSCLSCLVPFAIVAASIVILACVFLAVTPFPGHKIAKKAVASSMISSMGMSLSQYKQDYGVYPPDHDDVRDKCSECLVYYLGGGAVNPDKPYSDGPNDESNHLKKTYFDFKIKLLNDYDGDGWQEFVDVWKRPYIYNVGVNSGTADPPESRCPGGSPRHRVGSYDLYSVGPDGRTGNMVDYKVLDDFPNCVEGDIGPDSFYEAACNDDFDGLTTAPPKDAPGSADDIANF